MTNHPNRSKHHEQQAKHTPGPWVQSTSYDGSEEHITAAEYEAVASCVNSNRKANARLIAAAPETAAERDRLKALNADLLAALKAIAKTSIGIEEKNGALRAWSDCCHIAQAAIAKAEER